MRPLESALSQIQKKNKSDWLQPRWLKPKGSFFLCLAKAALGATQPPPKGGGNLNSQRWTLVRDPEGLSRTEANAFGKGTFANLESSMASTLLAAVLFLLVGWITLWASRDERTLAYFDQWEQPGITRLLFKFVSACSFLFASACFGSVGCSYIANVV